MANGTGDDVRPDAAEAHTTALLGPIAVGGVGGSGTRLIAQLLLDLGFYLGNDLNESNDNLWFTLLFRRPEWLAAAGHDRWGSPVNQSIRIFVRAMCGLPLTRSELEYAACAAVELAHKYDYDLPSDRQPLHWTWPWVWSLKRVETLALSYQVRWAGYRGWGWKEPNTHIFLSALSAHLPDLKYIHVMRNGLDMAFSSNQAQVHNWGHLYGVAVDDANDVPRASLAYWIRANRCAIERGERLLGNRFLLVNYDRLCASPATEITVLLRFLDLDPSTLDTAHLFSLPHMPESVGRYRTQDLRRFSPEQIDAVRSLGFATD